MATRFAVATGNWSNTAIWDNGALPVSGDVIYPNGFTVTIDQDINIGSLNNNISNVYLANMNIPNMTSNTQPSGIANASSNTTIAFQAFDQNSSTQWNATTNNTGWVSFDYGTNKLIKRYYLKGIGNYPTAWNFEGWNGTSWDILETKSGTNSSLGYASPLLTHTTQYSLYRINVTTNSNISFPPQITNFEMTESTSASFGATTGGSFAVPSTLSGSRNIVQSGAGIVSNGVNTVVTTANTTGNTVNFNVSGSGVIFNSLWMTNQSAGLRGVSCDGTGTVNFNGDIQGNTTTSNAYTQGGQIYISAAGTVNINGNLIAQLGFLNNNSNQISINAAATLNITGNLIGSTGNTNAYNINALANNATINITGNLTSNIGPCVFSASNIFVNIPTGTITVTNASSTPAIVMTGLTSLLTINSPIINKANANAVVAYKMRFYSTGNPYWIVQNNLNQDITLAYGSATGAYPNEADVRFGVTYAASPTRTGTCRVPLPQYVSQGVLVDATVGTAYLSATDVWNVLTSTLTTAGSVGKLVTDNLNATVSSRATQTSVNTINTNVNTINTNVDAKVSTRSTQTSVDTANTNINTANTNINTINSNVDAKVSTRSTQTSVDTANTNINNLPANIWDKATNTLTTAGSIGERLKTASTVQTTGDQLASYQV